MHLLPVLGALEERRRGDPVVVIGIHSAKFEAENDPERVREAMARYGVRHPVVLDRGMRIWRSCAIRSWPTVVVLRPDGTVAAVAPGGADLGPLDAFVGTLLEEARGEGTLARAPLRLEAPPPAPPGILSFPGKVIALPDDRIAVSDSAHHRVLVLDLQGRVERVIGSGIPGLSDGPTTEACFRYPQGLAFDAGADTLLVADTGNHAVRAVHFSRRIVRTLAGTGELGRGVPRGAAPAREVALRSPWDLVVAGDYLLIAMAGAHQIWAFDSREGTIGVLAGSGRESIEDAGFPEAAFAQPSGLALAGTRVYLADSETSAVRYLDLGTGEVRTLVGTGLFDFGDQDGPGRTARLQHPMGIAHGPAGLFVADTYNDKIKAVDEATGEVRTVFAGAGDVTLREPAGICLLADGRLVVADTNHHRLVLVGPEGRSARVLEVRGAPVEVRGAKTVAAGGPVPADAGGGVSVLDMATVGAGDLTLRLRLEPPEGFTLAEGSRVSVLVKASPPLSAPAGDQGFTVEGRRRAVPVVLRSGSGAGESAVDVTVEVVLCSHGDGAACWPVHAAYRQPLRIVAADAPVTVETRLRLPVPA
jgi:DNA-binding beta-propeller fold protein YncE